jgi:hypothetical protein
VTSSRSNLRSSTCSLGPLRKAYVRVTVVLQWCYSGVTVVA